MKWILSANRKVEKLFIKRISAGWDDEYLDYNEEFMDKLKCKKILRPDMIIEKTVKGRVIVMGNYVDLPLVLKKMDKYDRMRAFYEMMLKRDKKVGARKSLNDDMIGVINSYL